MRAEKLSTGSITSPLSPNELLHKYDSSRIRLNLFPIKLHPAKIKHDLQQIMRYLSLLTLHLPRITLDGVQIEYDPKQIERDLGQIEFNPEQIKLELLQVVLCPGQLMPYLSQIKRDQHQTKPDL